MPEGRHLPKHMNSDKAGARESWIVVTPGGNGMPDLIQRPSLDNSVRLVNPPPLVSANSEEFRPPPPLMDLPSRTSSAGAIPLGASPPTATTPSNPNYKIPPTAVIDSPMQQRDRPLDAASLHSLTTPREALGHMEVQQPVNYNQDSAVLRKKNRGSGMLGTVFGTHEHRTSVEDFESAHSNQVQEKVHFLNILPRMPDSQLSLLVLQERHSFRSFFGTSREKEKERERERERERNRPVDNNDRTLWDMSRLIGSCLRRVPSRYSHMLNLRRLDYQYKCRRLDRCHGSLR